MILLCLIYRMCREAQVIWSTHVLGVNEYLSCSQCTVLHLYSCNLSEERSLRCGCHSNLSPHLPDTWLLMNSATVLLLDNKLKGWMRSSDPHALPVLTPRVQGILWDLKSKPRWCPILTESQGPEENDCLSFCHCLFMELIQRIVEGSSFDLYCHSRWTWYALLSAGAKANCI